MYADYDPDDYEDELQKILEGRDVEPDPEEPLVEKQKLNKSDKRPAKRVHDYDDEPVPEREDDDMENFIENDYEEGEEPEDPKEDREDEAKEVPAKKPKGPRRVSLNPRPKLDADRLKSKKGLVSLLDLHSTIKLKGKGFEEHDLNSIMFSLEHWAHRLFPKLAFDDFIEKAEQLGSKRAVSTFVKKIRMDLPLDIHGELVDEVVDQDDEDADALPQTAESLFDQAFGQREGESSNDQQSEQSNTTASQASVLTQEQRELIARKRLEALEKRRLRERQEQMDREKEQENENEKEKEKEKENENGKEKEVAIQSSQLISEDQMAALMDLEMDMDI